MICLILMEEESFPPKSDWIDIGFYKPAGTTSEVWKHFKLLKGNSYANRAICTHCDCIISRGKIDNKPNWGTMSMKSHLQTCQSAIIEKEKLDNNLKKYFL